METWSDICPFKKEKLFAALFLHSSLRFFSEVAEGVSRLNRGFKDGCLI